jgi:valyl-tRNA synthetase
LEGVVDLSAEAERLRAELDECVQNMVRVEKLVSNPNFLQKAKPEVIETEQARLQDLKERQQHLNEILEQLAD